MYAVALGDAWADINALLIAVSDGKQEQGLGSSWKKLKGFLAHAVRKL